MESIFDRRLLRASAATVVRNAVQDKMRGGKEIMKEYLIWHKECLANWKAANLRETHFIQNRLDSLSRTIDEANFYEYQIKCAMLENKDSFDRDRYKKN